MSSDYDKLRHFAMHQVKLKSGKRLINTLIDHYEKSGTNIHDITEEISKLIVSDQFRLENILKSNDRDYFNLDKVVSDYEQDMNDNGYGLYSNFWRKDDELQHITKYFEENGVKYIIGEAYTTDGVKIETSVSLYIKNLNKPVDERKELSEVIKRMPKIEYTREEQEEKMRKRFEDLK